MCAEHCAVGFGSSARPTLLSFREWCRFPCGETGGATAGCVRHAPEHGGSSFRGSGVKNAYLKVWTVIKDTMISDNYKS
eukprot:g27798.t1